MSAGPVDHVGWAAAGVCDLVHAPLSDDAEVIGRFPTALYIRTTSGRVLALVTRDGVALPNAVVLPVLSGAAAIRSVGDRVAVGAGEVRADGLTIRVVGTFPTRPRLVDHELESLLDGLGRVAERLGDHGRDLPLEDFVVALEEQDPALVCDAVTALVGVGPGLTPAGDDVLAGALALVACAAATGHRILAGFADALAETVLDRCRGRTTSLSETLLGHAAVGEMAGPARQLVRRLAAGRPGDAALDRLLRVGGSSGHDLALGLVLGGRAVAMDRRRGTVPGEVAA